MHSLKFNTLYNPSDPTGSFTLELIAKGNKNEIDFLTAQIGEGLTLVVRDPVPFKSLNKPIQEKKRTFLFKLFYQDIFVGYERWDEETLLMSGAWEYSYPCNLTARSWHCNYIKHDSKIPIDKIEGE